MCKILLAINPQFVDKILAHTKTFEYRKNRCRLNVDTIVIYSTCPVMRVVAEAEVVAIIEDTANNVWQLTKNQSGVSKNFFDTYFKGKTKAVAYKLGKIKKYEKPLRLSELGIKSAPQSFIYLEK